MEEIKTQEAEVKQEPTAEPAAPTEKKDGEEPKSASSREAVMQRYKSLYPDDNIDDEEVFFGHIKSDFDNYAKNDEYFKGLFENLTKDPKAAAIMSAVADGEPFEVAIAKYIDPEKDLPKEGDSNYERYNEARSKRIKDFEDMKARQGEIEGNLKATQDGLVSWGEKKGMTAEQSSEWFNDVFVSFFDKMAKGIVDEEMLDALYKAKNYEKDVEDAKRAGEVAGRNQQIEEKYVEQKGDGMPTGAPAGAEPQEQPKSKVYNPFLAGQAED